MTRRAVAVLAAPALLLTILIFGTAAFVVATGGDPGERLPDLIPWIIMVNHSMVLIAFVAFARREGLSRGDVGWIPLGGARFVGEIGLGILLGAVVVLFDDHVLDMIQRAFESTAANVGSGGVHLRRIPIPWLVAATVFPFVEETVYRGYGIGILGRRTSLALAVIVSCILFGLLHWGQGTWGVLNTAAIGAVYAGVFLWRRNLWSPTAAHVAFNAIVILRAAT